MEQLTLFAVDSLVRTFPPQESGQDFPANEAAYGLNIVASSPNADRNGSSSKTPAPLPLAALNKSYKALMKSGMTQSGLSYPLAPLVSHTCESACTLWPTPRANGGNNAGGSNSRKAAISRGTYISGSVSPSLQEWLMGFPEGWTDLSS